MADVGLSTYPTAEDCMQLARAIVNDMLRDTKGRILTDTASFTLPYLNSAIRQTNRYLADNGLPSLIKDNVILTNLTPASSQDPSVQVSVSANGYFDGVNQLSQPALPLDLILPLTLWERQTGAGANFERMDQPDDGIQSQIPGSWFKHWEWRGDAIYMPGSTVTEDIRLRYAAQLPAIQNNANLSQTYVQIRDGYEAVAYKIVHLYATARGSPQRTEVKAEWEDQCMMLINRQTRKDSRRAYRSPGFRVGNGTLDGALLGTTK